MAVCRNRMFEIWDKAYKSVCKKECNEETREAVKFIFSRNIVCGNALSFMCVDENGNDTDTPIVFSEWAFVTGSQMQRKDYTFEHLLKMRTSDDGKMESQVSRFDESETSDEGRFLQQYITHYRKVQENVR